MVCSEPPPPVVLKKPIKPNKSDIFDAAWNAAWTTRGKVLPAGDNVPDWRVWRERWPEPSTDFVKRTGDIFGWITPAVATEIERCTPLGGEKYVDAMEANPSSIAAAAAGGAPAAAAKELPANMKPELVSVTIADGNKWLEEARATEQIFTEKGLDHLSSADRKAYESLFDKDNKIIPWVRSFMLLHAFA